MRVTQGVSVAVRQGYHVSAHIVCSPNKLCISVAWSMLEVKPFFALRIWGGGNRCRGNSGGGRRQRPEWRDREAMAQAREPNGPARSWLDREPGGPWCSGWGKTTSSFWNSGWHRHRTESPSPRSRSQWAGQHRPGAASGCRWTCLLLLARLLRRISRGQAGRFQGHGSRQTGPRRPARR
jgi:hypothetical protein